MTSKTVLIAGCGYVGSALACELQKRGHAVWALRRSKPALKDLSAIGIQSVQADITKPETLKNLPKTDWVVICVSPNERSPEAYRKTYIEGVGNLIRVGAGFKPAPTIKRILYISSTSVYGQKNGEWVDENSPVEPEHETGKILLEAEKQVLHSGVPAVIFRLGGIYGAGRNRITFLKQNTEEIAQGQDYINLIHVADIVSGAILLLERGKSGEVYLGVDDEPVTRKEYFSEISCLLGIPPPVFAGHKEESFVTGRTNKRCRNEKLKALGFEFKYPSFREGYRELISAEHLADSV